MRVKGGDRSLVCATPIYPGSRLISISIDISTNLSSKLGVHAADDKVVAAALDAKAGANLEAGRQGWPSPQASAGQGPALSPTLTVTAWSTWMEQDAWPRYASGKPSELTQPPATAQPLPMTEKSGRRTAGGGGGRGEGGGGGTGEGCAGGEGGSR